MQAAQHHHHLLGRSVPLSLYSRDARQWIHLTQAIDGVGGVHAESAAATGQHASSTSRASVPKEGHTILTLLTYNVFSGSSTPSNSHPGKRRTAALRVIQRAQPDVIALQEVSSEFERCLRRENWFRRDWITTSLADYFDVSTGGRSTSINARREDDGCLLALRRALLNRGDKDETREKMMTASAFMLRLDGDQGKVLVSVQGPSDTVYSTSHFESLSSSVNVRKRQYERASRALALYSHAFLLGDFNHASYAELAHLLGNPSSTALPDTSQIFQDITLAARPSADRAAKSKLGGTNGTESGSSRAPLQRHHRQHDQYQHPSRGDGHAQPSSDWEFRHKPTFGELFPFFDRSRREKRKPRRIDLVLVRSPQSEVIEIAYLGDRPMQTPVKRDDQSAGSGRPSDQNEARSATVSANGGRETRRNTTTSLRCSEGKNGLCCEQLNSSQGAPGQFQLKASSLSSHGKEVIGRDS